MEQPHFGPPSELILNGWKEIANHMRRGVRTVQRWERLGLPVHRPSTSTGTSVIASTRELDEWLTSTNARPQDMLRTLQARIKLLEAENAALRREIMQLSAGTAKQSHRKAAGERSAA
jgi:hypothetical protein